MRVHHSAGGSLHYMQSNACINARMEVFVSGALWASLPVRNRGEIKCEITINLLFISSFSNNPSRYFQILTEDFFVCLLEAVNKVRIKR